MQLMTNINNSEKSSGAPGIEEQSVSATQIVSEPPPIAVWLSLFLSSF